jgi:hypothetical protein
VALEETLNGWTGPSSATEKDKQDRTERMVREAVQNHPAFKGVRLTVYAKGSYANNTNVRADSDVDIVVQCHELEYWKEEVPGTHASTGSYSGPWTPTRLRAEVGAALRTKFGAQVDESGSKAFGVNSGSARVDADVVPCFDYRYYFASGGSREGTRIFTTDGHWFENFPAQQLVYGTAKNDRTNTSFKKAVRVVKRIENAMVESGAHREVASFFVECLVYNCPDPILRRSTWTEKVRGILVHLWGHLEGAEPTTESNRWLEVNECKYLFTSNQDWTRGDGRDFAKAAWNYLRLGS